MKLTRSQLLRLTDISEPRFNRLIRDGFADNMEIGGNFERKPHHLGFSEVTANYIRRDYDPFDAVRLRVFDHLFAQGFSVKEAAKMVAGAGAAIDSYAPAVSRLGEVFVWWITSDKGQQATGGGTLDALAKDFSEASPSAAFFTPETIHLEAIHTHVRTIDERMTGGIAELEWSDLYRDRQSLAQIS